MPFLVDFRCHCYWQRFVILAHIHHIHKNIQMELIVAHFHHRQTYLLGSLEKFTSERREREREFEFLIQYFGQCAPNGIMYALHI